MNTILAVLACVMLACSTAPGRPDCNGLSAQEVGTQYGDAVSGIARAFAQAGLFREPSCDGPQRDEKLCSLMNALEDAVARVNKAAEVGCFDENGDYAQTPDAFMFNILQSALSSKDEALRWQILLRMFILCEDGTLLTPSGMKGCGSVVEESAATILRVDKVKLNRHLALEILGTRLATERSRGVLLQVSRAGGALGNTCPHGLSDTGGGDWQEIAEGLAESRFLCEQQLAREGLQHLDQRKGSAR